MKISAVVIGLIGLLPFALGTNALGNGAHGGASPAVVATRSVASTSTTKAAKPGANNARKNSNGNPLAPRPQQQSILANHSAVSSNILSRPTKQFAGNYIATPEQHRGYWGGGIFFGAVYGPGYYWMMGFYPGIWYYNPYGYGYQYAFGEPANLSGITFDLDEIPKEDRKAVMNGQVLLDGENATYGRVKNFSGIFRVLHVEPGTHDVVVKIAGGEIAMTVAVQEHRTTHVALSFDQKPKPPADQQSSQIEQSARPTLTPAPAEKN